MSYLKTLKTIALLILMVGGGWQYQSSQVLAAEVASHADRASAEKPDTKGSSKSADSVQQPEARKVHAAAGRPMHYVPKSISPRAEFYYSVMWGVDELKIKSAESDELIRFSYRVVDPAKAQVLNDAKHEPALIDPKAGVKLAVPALEKVGKLRQSSTPLSGKVYWMAFSNRGRMVKRGDRVNVVIGRFIAQGLVVE